ncbi:MAG TPA: hypothetical protein IAB17_03415 [Candidatus Alectryocaccobium stercorigallinarum]|nr:hypothetical protein [Candidatus Alectryocaccobium stercorigallinarum]
MSRRKKKIHKSIFVLTANPAINIERVTARYESGGHFVEYDKVVERYYKSLKNIKELLEICDIMHVYDNSSTPYRIIRKHKEFLTIYPNEFWSVEEIDKLIK